MSADLQWMIIRNTSSFMVKKRNISKPFSKEPHNLNNLHSIRYSGLVNHRGVGVEATPDGKGIVMVHKKTKYRNKPAKNLMKSTIKRGARTTLKAVNNFFKTKYRRDLRMRALRRASAIMKSQKPVVMRKGGARKKAE